MADGIRIILTEDGAAGVPASNTEEYTRWVIEGPADFSLVEEHGVIPEMTFDLSPGPYRVTVWNVDTGAAASEETVVAAGEITTLTLELSLSNTDIVAETMERLNSE